jgi:Fe-S cluster assembly protein SufD
VSGSALARIVRETAHCSLQGEAAAALERVGLPSRRTEAWRWSDLGVGLTADVLDATPFPDCHVLALADDIAVAEKNRDVIALLASVLSNDPSTWDMQARATREQGGSVSFVEVRSEMTIVESLDAHGGVGAHALTAKVAAGAKLTRVLMQRGDGIPLSTARITLEEDAVFRQFVIAEGAKLVRIETHIEVAGSGAEIALCGLYLAGAGRHVDLTSTITHVAPGGTTHQLIKGVARKGGRGVFQGKILVARNAQKTDARQHHHALLLEEGAEIFSKPELEIYADDVQCAHGNTAGALDEAALFYMRQRGIPKAEARALLIEAFLHEAVPDWLEGALREEVTGRIGAWLRGAS